MVMDTDSIIKKWLPYLSGIIIIGGLLYLIFFYLPFGIEIVQYIDMSDCLLLRLDKFTYFILFVAICYFLSRLQYIPGDPATTKDAPVVLTGPTIIENTAPVTANNTAIIEAVNDTMAVSSRPRLINRRNLPLYAGLSVVYNVYWFEKSTSTLLAWVNTIFGIGLFLLTMLVFRNYFFQPGSDTKKKNIFNDFPVVRLAFLYFAFMSFLGFSNATLISGGYSNSKEQFRITLKSSEVLNNSDSLVFVGRIKNYNFLYNPRTSSKVIVPAGEVMRCDMTSIASVRQYDTCCTCLCLP
jgi:hypothetical protein